MKTGLILEGGAMRGLFSAGIIDVLMENDISFNGIIGVSAGAAFGCNYKSNQIGRTIRYNLKYCSDKRFCSLRSLVFTGDLYGADFCYREIPEKLDVFDNEAFKRNPAEFYIVCTDIVTGKPVYKKIDDTSGNNIEWIRASASMPMVSKIVEIDGMKLLDGGITDSVPVKFFRNKGYDKSVVILTQPEGYVKEKNNMLPLIRKAYKKYPALIQAMEIRHKIYNDTLSYIKEKEKNGEILVLRPDNKLPVNHIEHNPEKLQQTYNLGRMKGISRLNDIKDFLR